MAHNLSYNYRPMYALSEEVVSKLKFILLNTLDDNVSNNLNSQTQELKQIKIKLRQSQIQQQNLIEAIQLIFTLLDKGVDQYSVSREGEEKEYQILQSLVQKQQAINRQHIKLEQQMQLYLQNLQQKVHQLEDKLNLETIKNKLLTQKNRLIEQQLNIVKSYKSKFSVKQKTVMDKIAARAEKISNQKFQNKLFFKESRVKRQNNLLKNEQRSKIWLYDRNIRKKHVSQEASLKNLSKSVHAVANQRRKKTYLSQSKAIQPLKVRKILQRSSFSHLS